MTVWLILAAVVVVSLVAAWLYDARNPGARSGPGLYDTETKIAMGWRKASNAARLSDRQGRVPRKPGADAD